MGQKINPLGFRLGTTQGHHSLWFAQPKNYLEGLQEDKKIRDYIKNYVQKNIKIYSGLDGITRIEIKKRIDLIQNAVNINFVTFSDFFDNRQLKGDILSIFVIAIAAAEAAIRLAIVSSIYRNRKSTRINQLNLLTK